MPDFSDVRPKPSKYLRMLFYCLLPLLLGLLDAAVPHVHAQNTTEGPSQIKVADWGIGFQGYVKLGHWTEGVCNFSVEGGPKVTEAINVKLRAIATDPLGNLVQFESGVHKLESEGEQRIAVLLQVGKPNSSVQLSLLREDTQGNYRSVATKTFSGSSGELQTLELEERLLLTLGECVAAKGFESLSTDSSEIARVQTVQISEPLNFPVDWRALSSVDCVFLSDVSKVSTQQHLALQKWILSGGRAVISLGTNAAVFRDHPISKWFPVTIGEDLLLRELTGIESYAGRSDRIQIRDSVPSVFLQESQGVALAKSLSGPLILRRSYGLGRVTVIGVNINELPFVVQQSADAEEERSGRRDETEDWQSLPLLCWKLCEFGDIDKKRNVPGTSQLTQAGIGDFKTQLLATNDARFEVTRPSVWTSLGILVVYLLIVGPVDYLLVHKVLQKPEWTWYSFPVWVMGACIVLALAANSWNGKHVQIASTKIVDYDLETGLKHSREFVSLYSSQSRRFDISLSKEGSSEDEQAVCWTGVPETGVAGMYRSEGFRFGQSKYEFTGGNNDQLIRGVPVSIWSSAHFLSSVLKLPETSIDQGKLFVADLSATASGQLRGTIQHRFEGKLKNWLLAYGNRVYHPDGESPEANSIAPHQIWSLDNPFIRQRELKGYLTGSRAMSVKREQGIGEDVVILQDDYDPLNTNMDIVARMLTFYEKVGGRDYTRLTNSELHPLDMSRLLDLKRAVFIARLETEKTNQVVIDGEKREAVNTGHYVRIVIPIERKQQDIKVLPKFDDDE